MTRRITLAQARRTAITAQGLAGASSQARPVNGVTMRHLQRLIDRVGLLQIDSVNVLTRAHLLPVMARLGRYDVGLLDRATRGTPARPRRLVEYWAHEASFVPPWTYQLLRWRMASPRSQSRFNQLRDGNEDTFNEVLDLIGDRGPLTGRQVHQLLGHDRGPNTHWGWNWTAAKHALEAHFRVGNLSAAFRTPQFERAYDLTERVLPPTVLALEVPDRDTAIIELVEIAARAHGLGSTACLADYFRLTRADTQRAIAHLVCAGVLEEVQVRDWNTPAYLHTEARMPRKVAGRALLAPFDPLVFERRRLAGLFGMHYRIEIYTPASRRQFGYYVLPFLLGDMMAARVDLKAVRARSELLVRSAFAEADAPPETATALALELGQMARWLGLDHVRVEAAGRGDLLPELHRQLAAAAG